MSKKLLIIDDDKELLHIMNFIFQSEGYDIITCFNPKEYIAMVDQHQPDLVIIDYMLNDPHINGGTLCRELKASSVTASLPVIIFSVMTRPEEYFMSYGCGAFIAKPFELPMLLEKVNDLLDYSSRGVAAEL